MNNLLKWLHEEQQQQPAHGANRRADSPTEPHSPLLGRAPILDPERCTGCGACVGVCMVHAIAFDGVPSFDNTRCDACGACIAMCPEDALSWPLGKR